MKNIKHFSLAVMAFGALIGVTGCGSDEKAKESSAVKERKQHQMEHPDWAKYNDARVTAVCDEKGVASFGPVTGRNNYDGAGSQTIGVMVACKDGTVHTVIVQTPSVN